jgi:two-component system nitrate/nitrite response regulator NarL
LNVIRRPRRVRVLLVEDNDIYAEAVQLLLESVDEVVVVGRASHGAAGVDLACALAPDCILMDISMPVMDGIEATRLIRDRLPVTRIVMLTSSDDLADRAQAEAAGADAYLTKENRVEVLAAAITGVAPARQGVLRATTVVAAA